MGVFDPYSDDPRLAVKKLCLCPVSGLLAVAGTAGQIVVAEFSDAPCEKEIPVRRPLCLVLFISTLLCCWYVLKCLFTLGNTGKYSIRPRQFRLERTR